MEHPANDSLPNLFYWISDNRSLWQKLCHDPELKKDDFIEILESLRGAGLYQMVLILLANASHRGFLYGALQEIMIEWCETQLTAERLDRFIGLLLSRLEEGHTPEERI